MVDDDISVFVGSVYMKRTQEYHVRNTVLFRLKPDFSCELDVDVLNAAFVLFAIVGDGCSVYDGVVVVPVSGFP